MLLASRCIIGAGVRCRIVAVVDIFFVRRGISGDVLSVPRGISSRLLLFPARWISAYRRRVRLILLFPSRRIIAYRRRVRVIVHLKDWQLVLRQRDQRGRLLVGVHCWLIKGLLQLFTEQAAIL